MWNPFSLLYSSKPKEPDNPPPLEPRSDADADLDLEEVSPFGDAPNQPLEDSSIFARLSGVHQSNKPKQLDNPALAPRLKDIYACGVWPFKITVHNEVYSQWDSRHQTEPFKLLGNSRRPPFAFSLRSLEIVKCAMRNELARVKNGEKKKVGFDLPQEVLEIEYMVKTSDGEYQYVSHCFKLGGKEYKYHHYDFNQHEELVHISPSNNTHSTPLVAVNDEDTISKVFAFGCTEWKGEEQILHNIAKQFVLFGKARELLELFVKANLVNKSARSVFPLQAGSSVPTTPAAATSSTVGSTPNPFANCMSPTIGSVPGPTTTPALNRGGQIDHEMSEKLDASFKETLDFTPPKDPVEREKVLVGTLKSIQKESREKKVVINKMVDNETTLVGALDKIADNQNVVVGVLDRVTTTNNEMAAVLAARDEENSTPAENNRVTPAKTPKKKATVTFSEAGAATAIPPSPAPAKKTPAKTRAKKAPAKKTPVKKVLATVAMVPPPSPDDPWVPLGEGALARGQVVKLCNKGKSETTYHGSLGKVNGANQDVQMVQIQLTHKPSGEEYDKSRARGVNKMFIMVKQSEWVKKKEE